MPRGAGPNWWEKEETLVEGGEALVPFIRRYPLVLSRGEGVRVFDERGRAYWDFLAGIGVTSLGHNHPLVKAAIAEAIPLLHTSNLYWNRPAMELAGALAKISGTWQVFFANSGTEANEAAIKFIRRHTLASNRHCILSMQGGFHGRTLGSLAMTPNPKYQDPFRPLPEGFAAVAYDDVPALEAALRSLSPAAVMVEAIQGEAGVIVPRRGYLRAVADLCRRYGALLAVDAVQTGMGRTGTWFGFEDDEITPDLVTLAKGLGAGVPIGAVLARPQVVAAMQPGEHASTFGGNPLATRVGLAVVQWLQGEGLTHVRRVAAQLENSLLELMARHQSKVRAVRGRGLMWAIVLNMPSAPVVERLLGQGLLVNAIAPDVIRLLPPLVVDEPAIDAAVAILDDVLAGETAG